MRTRRITAIERIRRNYALEHAAVALLLERGAKPPIGGYSTPAGFVLWAKGRAGRGIASGA